MRWAFGVMVLASSTADAGDGGALANTPAAERPVQPSERFAIGVSEPVGWTAATFGISAYTAITPHVVLRANYTTHQPENAFDIGLVELLAPGGEDDGTHAGYIHDFSAGAMWFPRRAYDGVSVELDALVRLRHQVDTTEDMMVMTTDATTVGGRVTVGWTWRLNNRLFISATIGASVGARRGTMTTHDAESTSVTVLPGDEATPEGFVRFGVLAGPNS